MPTEPTEPTHSLRTVALLGSTGSIGVQAIEVITANPTRFRVVALAAGGGRIDLLADQAVRLGVGTVALADPAGESALRAALAERGRPGTTVLAGDGAVEQVARLGADVVLNGITGAVGLSSTLAALVAGSTLALANKESLVIGGRLVIDAAAPGQLVPVDSEHSALAQCLRAGSHNEVARLVLTASGGPFRGRSRADLAAVTPAQALAHPTWAMGPVITTNSATLVNKGLELIEAHLLFGVALPQIEVVVHPQSIVHSWVEFVDGSCVLQASPPDMKLPIALALGWPERVPGAAAPVDPRSAATWTFEPLDDDVFPAVRLAREVAGLGGTYPGVYNAANEQCVAAFLAGGITFTQIVATVAQVVADHAGSDTVRTDPGSVAEVLAADAWARRRADEVLTVQGDREGVTG